jgi:hypothetical protein
VTFLNLRAENVLLRVEADAEANPGQGLEAAELAAIVAECVAPGRGAAGRSQGALAHWLLGKGRLLWGDCAGARRAFSEVFAFVTPGEVTEEIGLAIAGWAQVAQDSAEREEAIAVFLQAARFFSDLAGGRLPAAACLAEAGLMLFDSGDLLLARHNLWRAWDRLEPAFAPSLAVRIALICAECEARLGESAEKIWLERAHSLCRQPVSSPTQMVGRTWGRPDGVAPVRTLTDRLLRRRGEHEDPIGAARDA